MDRAGHEVSAPGFWEDLYARGEDGWELGEPSPPLAAWLARGGRFSSTRDRPARVAIPGCGRGHDARLLARRGYEVHGFDFAEAAVAAARAGADAEGLAITFEQRDIFTLGEQRPGFFDAVWEYTCFCAIDPGRRQEYARVVHAVLRPGGVLLGCFYPVRDGSDGPPFPVSIEAVEQVLHPYFLIEEAGPPDESIERRRGLEWLVRATRRQAPGLIPPRVPAAPARSIRRRVRKRRNAPLRGT
jgi:SAM-dependent methyltransferase